MRHPEERYLDLLEKTLDDGADIQTRNGIRRTIYGAQLRFDLTKAFPLITTRKIPWKNPTTEICWFLRGDTNIRYLHEHDVHIWDANAKPDGEVGPAYGYQWRYGFGIDQIQLAVAMLCKSPHNTRNVVTAWNPSDMHAVALPPCHAMFQLHSDGKNLTLQWSQRSVDVVLGLPTNIAGYAILAHLFAKVSGQRAVELICDLGNIHIYEPHFDGVRTQLDRLPRAWPTMRIEGEVQPYLFNLEPSQFVLENYNPYPAIKFDLVA